MNQKIPVSILGATGIVGQKLVQLLIDHPWFEIENLCASEQSVGLSYQEAIQQKQTCSFPQAILDLKMRSCLDNLNSPILFSALSASSASSIELFHLNREANIISNSSAYRMEDSVPIIIPEVNSEHLKLIEAQQTLGKIITNPNCVVAGLALALKPLFDVFGIERAHVSTYQALSGAGFSGPSAIEMMDNLLPSIAGEAKKIELETVKVLASLKERELHYPSIQLSAQCVRVPISLGHFMNVAVKLKSKASLQNIEQAWLSFSALDNPLPSSQIPLVYSKDPFFPQPQKHRHLGDGQSVAIGQLHECACLDFKFSLLVNNLVRGAAASALLNAELLVQQQRLQSHFLSQKI